jgi:hypothetical protein
LNLSGVRTRRRHDQAVLRGLQTEDGPTVEQKARVLAEASKLDGEKLTAYLLYGEDEDDDTNGENEKRSSNSCRRRRRQPRVSHLRVACSASRLGPSSAGVLTPRPAIAAADRIVGQATRCHQPRRHRS